MTETRHIHFSREEFAERLAKTRVEMATRDLDALLVFSQEGMYWLTGYDTFGFCFFQCLIVRPEGEMTLVTRSADLRQARFTSILDNIRIWKDAADADPSIDLKAALDDFGLSGGKLGVEFDTQGLTARNWRLVEARLGQTAELVDASYLVADLRLIKSPQEIEYARKAGELGDASFLAARPLIKAGGDEGEILAAMQGEIFRRGGDYPGNEFIIGSGPVGPDSGALLCRFYAGRRTLSSSDQITLEWAGAYRHYHAALMRTVVIGEPRPEHVKMHEAAQAALLACEAALKPGRPMADVFDAHARTLDDAGLGHARLNACGYSLGAKYTPCWMDHVMFYEGAKTIMKKNMVFFLHMILMDSDSGAAMTLGRTSLVTEAGAEPLSQLPLDLERS
ncbi:MAG: Xaa-Pro peptidase family protein [Pseudomonadota bacterium]